MAFPAIDYWRKVAHHRGNPTRRFLGNCAPKLCPNGCLPSTNTVTYGEARRDILPELSRWSGREKGVSVRPDIVPPLRFPSVPDRPLQHLSALESSTYGNLDRAQRDCALTLSTSPHILMRTGDHRLMGRDNGWLVPFRDRDRWIQVATGASQRRDRGTRYNHCVGGGGFNMRETRVEIL
jgi:hypothetical protein